MSSNTSTRQRLSAVSLTAMLVLSVFGGVVIAGPAAAAGNADHDNETAVTTPTSGVLAGTVLGNVKASPDNYTEIHAISDTNDSKVELADNTGYVFYRNTSMTFEGENSTSGNLFSSANVSHDVFTLLEHEPGENASFTSTIYNTTNVSDSDAVTDEVTAYAEFTNDTGTEALTDADIEDEDVVTLTDEDGFSVAGFNLTDGDSKVRMEAEDRVVPNEDGTYYVVAANGSVADDVTTVRDKFDSAGKMSSVWSFWGPNAFTSVSTGDSTHYLPVYDEEAPDSAPDSYVVAKEMQGEQVFAYHGLAELDGLDAGDEVDMTLAAGTGTSGWFSGYAGVPSILQISLDFGGLTAGAGLGAAGTIAMAGAAARRRGGA
jgi:hypothetical protein